MPFGADPAAALPSRLGGLLPGPRSGRRAGPPRNPSCPPQTPQLSCVPKPAGPAGGRSGPAAAGRSAPGPALPRRGGERGRDPRDLLAGGTRVSGPLGWPPPCPRYSLRGFTGGGGGQSLSGFPTPGQTRSVWELLATGPALRAPGTGSPPFPPPWGGGHGAGGETGHSQTDQTEEGPDSRGEGKIPDGKNKGVNPGKEGCEIPPAPGLGR